MLSDDEESMAVEANEETIIDDRKHSQLVNSILSIAGKRNRAERRTVPGREALPENFDTGKGKVKLVELVGSLKTSSSHNTLKKQLSLLTSRTTVVETPLPKHQQLKVDRSIAYEESTNEFSKWSSIILGNRQAEQMQFPLQQTNIVIHDTARQTYTPRTPLEAEQMQFPLQQTNIVIHDTARQTYTPRTPLEVEIAQLLRGSEVNTDTKYKKLTAEESRAEQMQFPLQQTNIVIHDTARQTYTPRTPLEVEIAQLLRGSEVNTDKKWVTVVERSKALAEQMQFPLQQTNIVIHDTARQTYTPRTPLEVEIAQLLRGSEVNADTKWVTVVERSKALVYDHDRRTNAVPPPTNQHSDPRHCPADVHTPHSTRGGDCTVVEGMGVNADTKWIAVVKAEQMQFPLQQTNIVIHDTARQTYTPRTPLEVEIAQLLRGSEVNTDKKYKKLTAEESRARRAMSLQEARERHSQLRKHRVQVSYRTAKETRVKKIKSRGYRRQRRREKVKEEFAELEKMKTNDPEAFLDKLTEAENARIKERLSLRHRKSSKFAKKTRAFAKYDDEARESIKEMLEKKRELKQPKLMENADSSDNENSAEENDIVDHSTEMSTNPWMKAAPKPKKIKIKSRETIALEELQARQYLEDGDDDKNMVELEELEEKPNVDDLSSITDSKMDDDNESGKWINKTQDNKNISEIVKNKPNVIADESNADIDELFESLEKKSHAVKKTEKRKLKNTKHIPQNADSKQSNLKNKTKDTKKKVRSKKNIDRNDSEVDPDDTRIITETFKGDKISLNMENDTNKDSQSDFRKSGSNIDKNKDSSNKTDEKTNEQFVDPKNVLTINNTIESFEMPDGIQDADSDGDDNMDIEEAFADDDVIDDFKEDKEKHIDSNKLKDVDLYLPGWGMWGGAGVKVSQKRKDRFTVKAPPAKPRRDSSLGNVIINEKKDDAVAVHQIHKLPFPFKTTEQLEKSIATPVGKTWNPETAFKLLTKPKIITRLGTIIEPINKEETFKKHKAVVVGEKRVDDNQGLTVPKKKGRK